MTPNKLDLTITRGSSFELELISQIKTYVYDIAVHNGASDLKRTHAENLEHYGFSYAYINFLTAYASATLIVRKAWTRSGQSGGTALLSLAVLSGLTLTTTSVQIGIEVADTIAMEWDAGVYELLLTTAGGRVDRLIYGDVRVLGETA